MSFGVAFLLEMTRFQVFPLMFIVSKRHLPTLFIVHFQDIHKNEIKKKITQYNKFDTKVAIFVILEYLHNADHITPCKLKKREDIQDN
jgi:hypothetical protein